MTNYLADWLDEVSHPDYIWYIKRLSGNDTLANGTHQAGPYIPKDFLFQIFPQLYIKDKRNPDVRFNLYIDSHNDHKIIRAIWYNNIFHGGTRNETRLTNFGGISSAVLDPENTGALVIFAFLLDNNKQAKECHTWVCRDSLEEDLIEEKTGPIEPGNWEILTPNFIPSGIFEEKNKPGLLSCRLTPEQLPAQWLTKFPSGIEIIQKSIELRPTHLKLTPDSRLIERRKCEYEVFKSIEEAVELPLIKKGFNNIDEFISKAQTILQRRKSRSGRSLELHVKTIFEEEGLQEGSNFSYQPESELGKNPDYLFPSETAYKNSAFASNNLRMLAVKTTLRDRWRQILEEADRVKIKHLLTLQEGISENQFRDILKCGVQLVVPEPLRNSYPKAIRPHLQNLASFIGGIRLLAS